MNEAIIIDHVTTRRTFGGLFLLEDLQKGKNYTFNKKEKP